MSFSMFLKTTALCVAAALVGFAFYGDELFFLVKALALAFGFSIIFTLLYPHIRGIKKGDTLSIKGAGFPAFLGFGRIGFALTDSLMNKEVRVRLDNGKEAIGIVESYEGILSPPIVRILYEETSSESTTDH